MKKYIVIFIFLFCLMKEAFLLAQTYFVVQLKGEILNLNNNTLIKKGDKIDGNPKLKFSTGAKALLYNEQKGRFIIPDPNIRKEQSSELHSFLFDALLAYRVSGETYNLIFQTDVNNLEEYFGNENFLIIGNAFLLNLNPNAYPLIEGQSFVQISFHYDGTKVENVLPFEENKLIFSKYLIFQGLGGYFVETGKVRTIQIIYFLNYATQEKKDIFTFTPIFIEEEKLKENFDLLIKTKYFQEAQNENQEFYYFHKFLKDVYHSKVDESILKEWLFTNQYLSSREVVLERKN